MKKLKIGMLLFPDLTLLDFIGPYDVFVRASCFEVFVVSEHKMPIKGEGGLLLQPDYSFDDCPPVDIVFVPGGRGVTALLTNETYKRFLVEQAKTAQYITAVCTGSLLLAACGLLDGYKATTHWRSLELLKLMGVEVLEQRVVADRNRITGGGITAGIDFGLVLTAIVGGEDMAKTIQLLLEYTPEPPFDSGHPKTADPHILKLGVELTQPQFDKRLRLLQKIVL
ncbi:MAG: DJ-1/PfpI family protein [Imperialibacter sp.]